jgi:site-specific DNA-methyltransferase (adenine-specific)
MQNLEELSRLVEQSGFELTEGCASVCVAAPHYDPADRYRPLNFRRDPSADSIEHNAARLLAAARGLEENGLMFIYGLPAHLARYAAALASELEFRYWIGIRAATDAKPGGLRPEHTGLLLMSRPAAEINRIRIAHARCRHCGETLKDWGGKSHLMRADGAALSDVWMDMVVDTSDRMPPEVFERILLLSQGRKSVRLLCDDTRRASVHFDTSGLRSFDPIEWKGRKETSRKIPDEMLNRLHNASCLDALRAIPSETIDLAFADPPFNLTKDYQGYEDDRSDYTGWCKRWLVEYERALKPGGALFLVNLPRWNVWLADYLMRTGSLYLQNWIVWNSLPEPKGVLMPAHYSVLYLTKSERAARLNYCSMEEGWQPFDEAVFPPDRPDVCRRRSCIRKRRAAGKTWRGELTDVWYDIHRERVATAKTGLNIHPCRTPERLLDRIIRLATDPGDTILDAFAGVGTSAMVARRLGRNFIAIEQSGDYLRAAERRMEEQRSSVFYPRGATVRRHVSKRKLQLELQRLALMLERLPTRADVEKHSKYDLASFDSAFAQWSVAIKAAKAVLIASAERAVADGQFEMIEQAERNEHATD